MRESALGKRIFVEFVSVISKSHAAGSSNVENTLLWVTFWSKWIKNNGWWHWSLLDSDTVTDMRVLNQYWQDYWQYNTRQCI